MYVCTPSLSTLCETFRLFCADSNSISCLYRLLPLISTLFTAKCVLFLYTLSGTEPYSFASENSTQNCVYNGMYE